ncbi:MAGUK p55 subfamily member 5-like, partial [Tropilaelaps mercedesae]
VGSPADRADVQVGDEILEVNGRSLAQCTHTEVISHIHQCIRARCIQLRLQRRTTQNGSNGATRDTSVSLHNNSNTGNSFQLPAPLPLPNHPASPTLKEDPSSQRAFEEILPSVVDAPPPVGFTSDDLPASSVPQGNQTDIPRAASLRFAAGSNGLAGVAQVQHNIQHSIDDNCAVPLLAPLTPPGPAHKTIPEQGPVTGLSGPSLVGSNLSTNGAKQVVPPLAIPIPSPRRASEKLLNRPVLNKVETPQSPLYKNVQSPLESQGPPRSPLTKSLSSPPQSPLNTVAPDIPLGGPLVPLSLAPVPRPTLELSSGAHREMAVDVPDAFVPMTKQAPRYPPMKPSNDTLSRNTEAPKVDPKYRSLRTSGQSTSVPPGAAQTPQEQQMEMFLRSSIRQSKKLRELEKSPAPIQSRGVVNNAFEPELSGSSPLPVLPVPNSISAASVAPTVIEPQPTVDVTKLYDVSALQTALNRVIDYVGKDGSFDENLDVEKVMKVLDTAEFQDCLAVTNIIKQILCSQATPPIPVRCNARELCVEIAESGIRDTPEGQELLSILGDLNMTHLIDCHDRVSKIFGGPKNPPPSYVTPVMQAPMHSTPSRYPVGANPTPNTSSCMPQRRVIDPPPELAVLVDEGENARVIQIDKTDDPLGATVRNEGESIIVGRIVKGGAAEKSGLLHEGDEIVAVNGIEMRGKTVAQVSDELARMTGLLSLLIIPNDRYASQHGQFSRQDTTSSQQPVMHIKAHFDYDPEDDMYIPCRELGIGFKKGDILHIINMDDPNWWQAYKDGEDETTLAGLVPSKSFQLRREAIRQQLMGHTGDERESQRKHRFLCTPTVAKKSSSASLSKSSRKHSKGQMYNAATQPDPEESVLYEEVGLYYPRANSKRPIVLIGPSNIGKHELRQRLMEDTSRFAAAIPHTSRPRKDNETDGSDYHFISRAQFENDILNGRFVEHGEYERNYYGTSIQAIRAVVLAGQICVLNLHPESLKILKRSDLKPYVIFIAPPSLEKLRQNRVKVGASVKTEELKEIIEKARDIEDKYGSYFDSVIINHEQERAYRDLLKEIAFIEREPQWVPKQWLDYE